MSKKSKKKYKLKHKKVILITCLCLIILIAGMAYFVNKTYEDNILKTLKANYNQYIITNKKSNLYNKNYKKIGTISSGYYLELTKISNLTSKNKYLQIKDTPYYLSYKDIKKSKKQEVKETTNISYYLSINKKLKTKRNITLEKGKKKITLNNGLTTNLDSIDDQYYYISFLGDNFKVKKNNSMKVIGNSKDDKSHVSVILYNKINTNCSDDTCFHPNSVKAHITRLKKDGYYFITFDDYTRYLKEYINLKDKAVLLVTNDSNDYLKKIEEDTKVKVTSIKDNKGLKFTNNNKVSTRKDKLNSISNYYPKKYMIIDEYLKMGQGLDITDDGGKNTATEIAVVNYHFFYSAEKKESCNESICLDTKKFEEELKWLQENHYKTLTINEFADWKEGYIELPVKSVLLTIDDGAMGTGKHNGNKLIPLLEKYKEHATLFLITGWWSLSNYQSPYLDVQSHTHNLHFEARCADGRGMVACSDYKTVKKDLEQSLKVLGDKTSFCFPFYSSDSESLQALKELGFRVAFVGGNTKATRSQNNLLITRYPILSDITLQNFISMVE
ncbi:MAG: polysaccharide deacetylase family protein [Bacilli bacterium]|nr:polysaccharide deacetylase family protein [Bacilli bacterium]